MTDWTSEYLQLITDCENREERLSDWERGFVDSIKSQLAKGKTLSTKQIDRLDEIWEKATSRG
jgi:hypothetical protein